MWCTPVNIYSIQNIAVRCMEDLASKNMIRTIEWLVLFQTQAVVSFGGSWSTKRSGNTRCWQQQTLQPAVLCVLRTVVRDKRPHSVRMDMPGIRSMNRESPDFSLESVKLSYYIYEQEKYNIQSIFEKTLTPFYIM